MLKQPMNGSRRCHTQLIARVQEKVAQVRNCCRFIGISNVREQFTAIGNAAAERSIPEVGGFPSYETVDEFTR